MSHSRHNKPIVHTLTVYYECTKRLTVLRSTVLVVFWIANYVRVWVVAWLDGRDVSSAFHLGQCAERGAHLHSTDACGAISILRTFRD
jgi:hypothetical protein